MTDKLELKSSHEVIDTVSVADVDSIFQGKPTDPDILTVVMKGGRRLYCDEVCPVDSLQDEPVSDELDAASIAYAEAFMKDVNKLEIQQAKWHERHPEEPVIQGGIKACFIFMRNAFLDGAKWQKTKDEKTLRDFFNARNQGDASFKDLLAFKEGVETGRKEMEEQMMSKAIDGDITFDYYGDDDKTYGCIAHNSFCLEDFGLKDRDKAKVIVIKED